MPQSMLLTATRQDNCEEVKLAIQKGARIDYVYPEEGASILIIAVKANAYKTTQWLLQEGAEIDCRDSKFWTPLHWAIEQDNVPLVQLLLSFHAPLQRINNEAISPMMLAANKANHLILSLLNNIVTSTYHADLLALRNNINIIADEIDFISEARQFLKENLTYFVKEKFYDLLERILPQLIQPEEILNWDLFSKSKKKNILYSDLDESTISRFAQFDLKYDHAIFIKLNNILKLIDQLLFQLDQQTDEKSQFLKEKINKVKNIYTKFCFDIYSSNGNDRIESLQGRVRLRGFLGYRYLNAGVSLRFQPYLTPNPDEVASGTLIAPRRDNIFGTHTLLRMFNTFYKIRPTAPGIEHAFDSLNKIITGQGSAPTELLILEKGTIAVPVVASKEVKGENFAEVLDKHPDWLSYLDMFNYSSHLIMTLLTCPSDAKPDNFIAVIDRDAQQQIKKLLLVGIDNDLAFGDPITLLKKTPPLKHILELKSVFLCMPQIDQPVDRKFRQAFIQQSPVLLMMKWLKAILLQQDRYLHYQNTISSHKAHHTENKEIQDILAIMTSKEFNNLHLPIKFIPGTIQQLYYRLIQLHTTMQNPQVTHNDLVNCVYPLVARYYQYIRSKYPTTFKRLISIYGVREICFEELLQDDASALKDLNCYQRTYDDVEKDANENIEASCAEFFTNLDYVTVGDVHIQSYIIEKIGTDFSFLTHLTFRNCEALDDERLEALSHQLPHLNSLILIGCHKVQGAGLSALLCHHPKIQLILEDFYHLPSEHLLHLFQYCDDLKLVIQGKFYTLEENPAELIKIGIAEKRSNLLTALLLSGAHLKTTYQNSSPLHLACELGDIQVIRELLAYGASIDCFNEGRQTPLDITINELEKANSANKTTLYLEAIIQLLLSYGALVCQQPETALKVGLKGEMNSQFRTALYQFSCCHNLLTPDVIPILIDSTITKLDLAVPPRYKLRRFSINTPLIKAIAKHASALKDINLVGSSGINHEVWYEILKIENLSVIEIDSEQALSCGLITLKNFNEAHKLKKGNIHIYITHISFINLHFDKETLFNISEFIRQSTFLKSLELCGCHLGLNEAKLLATSISKNTSLRELLLNKNPFGDEGGVSIVTAALQLPQLTTLKLDETGIKHLSAPLLGSLLINSKHLITLSLYNNPLGNEGIEMIAKVIQQGIYDSKKNNQQYNFATLNELVVNQVGASEQGVIALTRVLLHYPHLEILDIGFNKAIGEKGAISLIQLQELNPRLKYLKADEIGADSRSNQRIKQLNIRNQQLYQKAALESYQINTPSRTTTHYVQSIMPAEYAIIHELKLQNQVMRQRSSSQTNISIKSSPVETGGSPSWKRINPAQRTGYLQNKQPITEKFFKQLKSLQDKGFIFSALCNEGKIELRIEKEPSTVDLKRSEAVIKLWNYCIKLLGSLGKEIYQLSDHNLIISQLTETKCKNLLQIFEQANIQLNKTTAQEFIYAKNAV